MKHKKMTSELRNESDMYVNPGDWVRELLIVHNSILVLRNTAPRVASTLSIGLLIYLIRAVLYSVYLDVVITDSTMKEFRNDQQ